MIMLMQCDRLSHASSSVRLEHLEQPGHFPHSNGTESVAFIFQSFDLSLDF